MNPRTGACRARVGGRHVLQVLCLAFCVATIGNAGAMAASEDPRQLVIDTTDAVLSVLRAEREAIEEQPGRVYEIIDVQILPHIDFDRMSRWVLGKYWRKATGEQRKKFVNEFTRLVVRTYATALLEYSDEKVEYPPMHMKSGADEVSVPTVIRQPGGGPAIPVNYSLYLNGDKGWKVYDMTIDGISLVTNYRSSFSSQIRRSSIESLISKLEEKNARADPSVMR